eukprot:1936184-Pleurochrysis_carterae.AAC.1
MLGWTKSVIRWYIQTTIGDPYVNVAYPYIANSTCLRIVWKKNSIVVGHAATHRDGSIQPGAGLRRRARSAPQRYR